MLSLPINQYCLPLIYVSLLCFSSNALQFSMQRLLAYFSGIILGFKCFWMLSRPQYLDAKATSKIFLLVYFLLVIKVQLLRHKVTGLLQSWLGDDQQDHLSQRYHLYFIKITTHKISMCNPNSRNANSRNSRMCSDFLLTIILLISFHVIKNYMQVLF